MPLTQIGPGAFVDLSLPAYSAKMRPWTAPGRKSPFIIANPDEKSPAAGTATAVARMPPAPPASVTSKVPVHSVGKSGLIWPDTSTVHPISLPQTMVREEFDDAFDALVKIDGAPGTFSSEQKQRRDDLAERVDLLRWFAFG